MTTATLSLTIIDYPFESGCGSDAFDDGRVGHARALAHRLQAVASACGLEVIDEGGQQAGARRAECMAERDRATPRVELGRVGAEFVRDVEPGEIIKISTSYGNFYYSIYDYDIKHYTDTSAFSSDENSDEDTLVMYTCYPFTLGYKSDRLYIYAEKIAGRNVILG